MKKIKLSASVKPRGIVRYEKTNTITGEKSGEIVCNRIVNQGYDAMFAAGHSNDWSSGVYRYIGLGRVGAPIAATSVGLSDFISGTLKNAQASSVVTVEVIEGVNHVVYTISATYEVGTVNEEIGQIGAFRSGSASNSLVAGVDLDTPFIVDETDTLTVHYSIAFPQMSFPITIGGGTVTDASDNIIPYTAQLRSDFLNTTGTEVTFRCPTTAGGDTPNRLYVNDSVLATGTSSRVAVRYFEPDLKRVRWTFDCRIRPTAGSLSITRIGFGNYITGTASRMLDLLFSSAVVKETDRKVDFDFEFEITWE